ncbi:MAG: hypothetical protein HQL21_04910 [Candidatus Omnitrophica bacterium]|nr:hypothetical protein [Candidatus Omnitrophota bacterium]
MKIFLAFFIAALVILSMILSDWSEARNITFLPRDEELQTVSIDYKDTNYKLAEITCTAGGNGTKLDRSMACVAARLDCPDCCLSWTPLDANGRPTMQSMPTVDVSSSAPVAPPYYKQTSILFNSDSSSSCTAVRECTSKRPPFPKTACATSPQPIAHCQERGCPGVDGSLYINARPEVSSTYGQICVPDGGVDKWLCNRDSLGQSVFSGEGCEPLSDDYKCKTSGGHPIYTITPAGKYIFNPAVGEKDAWRYEFTSEYKDCINKCINGAQGFERYERDTNCFLTGDLVCPASESGPGFLQNCVTYQCQQRIDWPECKPPLGSSTHELCCDNQALDAAKILEYQQAYNKCFDRDRREGGGCLDCFQPLGTQDKSLHYDFVARGNQKIFVIWQLQVNPHYCLTTGTTCPANTLDVGTVPTSYLYTTAKVFDITDNVEREIFPGTSTKGTLSQRAFSGAFSIFAATAVDKKDDERTNFLEQGHRYRVKLYWYIPSVSNAILTADVLWAQLTLIKTRD